MQPHFSNILMICAYIFKKNKDILFSKTRCSLPFQTNFELTSCAMLSCEFNFQILCLNVHTFTAVVVCVCVCVNKFQCKIQHNSSKICIRDQIMPGSSNLNLQGTLGKFFSLFLLPPLMSNSVFLYKVHSLLCQKTAGKHFFTRNRQSVIKHLQMAELSEL